jgi:hypothetical protein
MPDRHNEQETFQPALIDILLASLKALVAVGQADTACRLAGEACAVLRGRDPAGWQKFDVFLHRAAKHVPTENVQR